MHSGAEPPAAEAPTFRHLALRSQALLDQDTSVGGAPPDEQAHRRGLASVVIAGRPLPGRVTAVGPLKGA